MNPPRVRAPLHIWCVFPRSYPGLRVCVGLDPASRRRVWRILERAKTGRALVVTTHHMGTRSRQCCSELWWECNGAFPCTLADEADLLCDRVAIVTQGRMRCLGTQNHLKQKFGEGYMLQINYPPSDGCEVEAVATVQALFPAAVLSCSFRGFAAFTLPVSNLDSKDTGGALVHSIADVFECMQRCTGSSVITDWCVGQVSLEDVFQHVVLSHRNEEDVEASKTDPLP
jgi:hypothetical protein